MKKNLFFLILLSVLQPTLAMEQENDDFVFDFLQNVTTGLTGLDRELVAEVVDGNSETVTQLLDEGANPNVRTEDGLTPLMLAANQGDDELCKMLLAAHADIHMCDNNGISVLGWAVGSDKVSTCQMFLEAGAQVNKQDLEGRTALMNAVEWSDGMRVTKLLLKYGADPEIKNKAGKRARECADIAIESSLGAAVVMWPETTQEDRNLALESIREHNAIPILLNDPEEIQRKILKSKKNSRMKRLKRNADSIHEALFNRELGI